jgi:uncharacterized repeat protein (TIGR02543 family)
MAIPNVSGALRGWLKSREVYLIVKTVVNHLSVQYAEVLQIPMMLQPLQPSKLVRKPEEQRNWKWFEILTKKGERLFKHDDKIWVDGIGFRIDSVQPWDEGGYRRYEATEDYSGVQPQYKVSYSANDGEGHNPPTYAYEAGAIATAAANPYTREGFTFTGWNTEEDGYGTAYAVGASITIGLASVVLYAQWEISP